jgi:DNA-binding beta-propeller fold protein YncE
MKSKYRVSLLQISQFLAVGLFLVWPAAANAQTVVATIPVNGAPPAVAVNPVTKKIYVASCGHHVLLGGFAGGPVAIIDGQTNASITYIGGGGCASALAVNAATNTIYFIIDENVAVIDFATNSKTVFADSNGPEAVAVNPVTNKIYVANKSGNVNVIDGATNSVTTVTDPNASGLSAVAIAVNPVMNKIYVANNSGGGPNPGSVTVIDGATNSTTTVTDPNAISPNSLAVNPATNKVYVTNGGNYPGLNHGNITVIDGATNSITTLTDPNALAPQAVAVNQTTNKIYVANPNDSALTGNGGVTIIDGATNAVSTVKDPNAIYPHAVAVDSVTNTIYVANGGCSFLNVCSNPGSVTVINGATGTATTIIDPNASAPNAVALNPTTNKIYVVNGGGNVTVIDGSAAATSHILSVLLAGNGLGSVTSNPAGINCGTSCIASFASGTAVSLTDSPASGSSFSGWSTACTESSACNLTMSSDGFVTATFNTTVSPDFSLQPASASLTVQGGSVNDVITISPKVGTAFRSIVQLSCVVSGPTPMATCTLSPTSVTPGANSAASTLTVVVPSRSAGLIPFNEGHLSSPPYAVFLPIPLALIGLGLASGKSKNRRRSPWLLCSLFTAFAALQAGCGGGSSNPPPLNYTVTVTATSGAIQHTTQVTVTVP